MRIEAQMMPTQMAPAMLSTLTCKVLSNPCSKAGRLASM